MSWFRVTLHRSAIGLPERVRLTLRALGLRKRNQTVFQPVSKRSAGQIFKIKELVKVEEVAERETKAEMAAARRPDPGFYLERRPAREV